MKRASLRLAGLVAVALTFGAGAALAEERDSGKIVIVAERGIPEPAEKLIPVWDTNGSVCIKISPSETELRVFASGAGRNNFHFAAQFKDGKRVSTSEKFSWSNAHADIATPMFAGVRVDMKPLWVEESDGAVCIKAGDDEMEVVLTTVVIGLGDCIETISAKYGKLTMQRVNCSWDFPR